jgi:hypothetical protein
MRKSQLYQQIIELLKTKTITLACLICFGFSGFLIARELFLRPKFHAQTNHFDAGIVRQGELLEHVFSFTNEGFSELVVNNIHASCACAYASVGNNNDRSYILNVKMNMPRTKTSREVKIVLETNDPRNPIQSFTLTARTTDEMISYSASAIDFKTISSSDVDQQNVREITIMSKDPRAFLEISSVEVMDPVEPSPISVALKQTDDPAKLKIVTVLRKNPPIGPFTAKVAIKFRDERIQPTVLPVTGAVLGEVNVAPSEIFTHLNKIKDSGPMILKIQAPGFYGPFTVSNIYNLHNQIDIIAINTNRFRIEVKNSRQANQKGDSEISGGLHGVIQFTSDTGQVTVNLPINIFVD